MGSSVSAKTDIVVVGPDAGQKVQAAQAKGVEIWDEAQFLSAVGDGSGGSSSASGGKGGSKASPAEAKSKPPSARSKKAAAAEEEEKAAPAPKPASKRGGAKAKKEEEEETKEEEAAPPPKATGKRGASKAKVEDVETAEETKPKRGAAKPKPAEAAPAEAGPASKKRSASKKDEDESPSTDAPAAKKPNVKKDAGDGARRPDRLVPGGSDLRVYQDYDVKLMYTDIGTSHIGSNKFYIIQVLEGRGKYYSWNRWGRLGENGDNKLEECATAEQAIKLFEQKFQQKTKNKWANRGAFVRHADKYQLVETEQEEGGEGGAGGASGDAALGRLSVSQINKGQAVLEKVRAARADA